MSEEIENGNPDLAPIANKLSSMFSFKLTDDFVASYKEKTAPFGYRDAGGNSVVKLPFFVHILV